MATIQELMLRAQLLKQETALDSISPERAGGIMYDTLAYINQMQLQGANPLLISKIYASVAAMEADSAPVSDLTGQALRPGQVVVIASADSDNGSVYRYNGGPESRWTVVGKIGNLTPVDSLDSDSTQLPLAAHQGKVLDEKVSAFVSIARYCDIIKNYYIRYSDGASIGSGSYFQEYVLNVAELNGRKVWVKATSRDNVPAVIAFYSGATISTANYMSADSIQHNIVNNVTIADTTIPTGAVLMVVTTRNDTAGITEPTILLQDSAVPATLYKENLEKNYRETLLNTFELSGSVNLIDFSTETFAPGDILKFVVTYLGEGQKGLEIGYNNENFIRDGGIVPYYSALQGDVYYFFPPEQITRVRVSRLSGSADATVQMYKVQAPDNYVAEHSEKFVGNQIFRNLKPRLITPIWTNDCISYTQNEIGLRVIRFVQTTYRLGTQIFYCKNPHIRISLTDATNYRYYIYGIKNIDDGSFMDYYWRQATFEGYLQAQAFAVVLARKTPETTEPMDQSDITASGIKIEFLDTVVQTEASYNDIIKVQEQIDELSASEMPGLQRNERLGTLEIGRLYHHLNVEAASFVIPSQSLADIAYAKALGFKVIEANVQTCSDGVVVIKHGNSGKLGAGLSFAAGSGLSADTLFSAVTSTSLRQNVTYNSTIAKYNGHIPTLEEFCAECARLDMIPYLRGVNVAGLAIARKYLPDERIIVEGPSSRGDFRGIMTNYGTLETAAGILAVANTFGAPYFYGFGHMSSLSDSVVSDVFKTMHENGYMLAGAYIGATAYLKYKGMGLDLLASITDLDVPEFFHGNTLNILGCSASELVLNSASYAAATGTISMNTNGTIKVNSAAIGHNMSKLCLRIMFSGSLDIQLGASNSSTKISALNSSGEQEFVIAQAVQNIGQDEVLVITAKAATEIIDISVYGSVVIGL